MRFARQLHLWIGLVLAFVLLVEAVTGLMLAEPKLFGQQADRPPGQLQTPGTHQEKGVADLSPPTREKGQDPSSLFNAKGIHKGIVGGYDLGWLISVSAIGLMLLIITGLILAIPRFRKKRRY